MSKKVSNAEYKDAQAAQKFYSDSLNLLVANKGYEFLEVLNKYISDSRETAQSIFETYQSDGKHFLHVAASTACVEVVEYAISCPNPAAFVNIADSNGFTPLMNATVAESSVIMALLIKHGADINARNNDGATSLHFAAGDGSIERMELLCEAGCDITLISQAGSPISWAAGSGKPDAIRYLAGKGCDVNAVGANGIPAVLMAAVAPNEDCVVALIDNGADVGHVVTGQLTLLHICAEGGMVDAVSAILKSQTGQKTARVVNNDGNLPLHLAAMGSHEEVIRLLAPFSGDLPAEYYITPTSPDGQLCMPAILADGKRRLDEWMKIHNPSQTNTDTSTEAVPPATPQEMLVVASEEDTVKSELLKTEGNGHFANKKYDNAVNLYSQALSLSPHNHAIWSNRSACFLALAEMVESGDHTMAGGRGALELKQMALKDAEMCRRMKPDWPKGCYRLALARLALGMYEDSAVAAYEGCQLDDENLELKSVLKKAVKLGQEEHRRSMAAASSK